MEMTISKILSGRLPRLKTQEEAFDTHEGKEEFTNQHNLVEKATYIGIECEIEGVTKDTVTGYRSPYWTRTDDGSLRNFGKEFISAPIRVTRVERALNELFNKELKPGYTYSNRTSTHIHMNVRTLTVAQLQSLVLVYMVFEKALFNWIGQEREKNIFCVPLYDIRLTTNIVDSLDHIQSLPWAKYTALNLKPILDKGTIEFRHLYGTNDTKTIITWINFLLSLKKFALKNTPEIVRERISTLNTTSDYYIFSDEVFGNNWEQLLYDNYKKDMSFCVTNIKCNYLYKTVQREPNTKLSSLVYKNKRLDEEALTEVVNRMARRVERMDEAQLTMPNPWVFTTRVVQDTNVTDTTNVEL